MRLKVAENLQTKNQGRRKKMKEISLEKFLTIFMVLLLIVGVSITLLGQNYERELQKELQKPFVFADFKTVYWLSYENALKDVNRTCGLEYIAQMRAVDQGYIYVGYTFTIAKADTDPPDFAFYTVHFQWWAKRQ